MTRTSEKAFYDDIWLAWREMQRCAPAPRYLRRMVMKELGRRMRRMCKRHIVVSVPGGELDDCGRRNGHDRHYTKADLVQKMERTGFRVTRAFTCGGPCTRSSTVSCSATCPRMPSTPWGSGLRPAQAHDHAGRRLGVPHQSQLRRHRGLRYRGARLTGRRRHGRTRRDDLGHVRFTRVGLSYPRTKRGSARLRHRLDRNAPVNTIERAVDDI